MLRPPQFEQSIALAVLLHIWLVLVLGSAPGGMARPGDGVWGRVGGVIDVRLSGLLGDKAEPAEPAPPLTKTGPLGSAKQERFGGAVRAATPVEPEAATPGAVRLGRWNSQAGDADASTPPNRITALPTEAVRPVPAAAANLALQAMPVRAAAPTAPPAPVPSPVIEQAPEPVPVPAPVVSPVVAPVVSPVVSPVVAPVVAPAPAPTPAAVPEAAAPRAEPTPTPTPTPTPAPAPPQPSPVQPNPAQTPAAASPGATAGTSAPYPAPAGRPDAGSRVGRDVATPASTPPTAAREPLNLSLPRGAAVSRMGGSGLFELMPHPPERKNKIAEGVDAAAKADCRKAYSDAGLLAAVPLLIDAARDKGCRW